MQWRWSCAALHAAVQAAIVVSIAGSAKIGAMRVKDQAKWIAAYGEGRWSDLPDERSDDFLPLYRRMKEQLDFSLVTTSTMRSSACTDCATCSVTFDPLLCSYTGRSC